MTVYRHIHNTTMRKYEDKGISVENVPLRPSHTQTRIKSNSVLQIKRSATNMFVTFTVNGSVLFSCSAGTAGLRKKERRLRSAAFEAGNKFGQFSCDYMKRAGALDIFYNMTIILKAPAKWFRWFWRKFRFLYTEVLLENNAAISGNYRRAISAIKKASRKLRMRSRLLHDSMYGLWRINARHLEQKAIKRVGNVCIGNICTQITRGLQAINNNSCFTDYYLNTTMPVSVPPKNASNQTMESMYNKQLLSVWRINILELPVRYRYKTTCQRYSNISHTHAPASHDISADGFLGKINSMRIPRAWLFNLQYFFYRSRVTLSTGTVRSRTRYVHNAYASSDYTLNSMYTHAHIAYNISCIARDNMWLTHTYSLQTPGIYSHIIAAYTLPYKQQRYTDSRSETLLLHVRKIATHLNKLRNADVAIEPPYRIRFFIMNEQTTFPFNGCRGKRYT